MRNYDLLDNREPKSHAFFPGRIKGQKYLLFYILRDAVPGVSNSYTRLVLHYVHFHGKVASFRHCVDRVYKEIGKCLPKQDLVSHNGRRVF